MSAREGICAGLTGGIASGKSTVAAMFREKGAFIIDADQIARDLVSPNSEALQEIVDSFGPDVCLQSGELDRKQLASIIFADPAKRQRLNEIMHPRIGAESHKQIQEARKSHPVTIYEAALLIESGAYRGLDGVILVVASPSLQLQRLQKRENISCEAARQKIDSQLSDSERLVHATWTISTKSSLQETALQVTQVWEELAP